MHKLSPKYYFTALNLLLISIVVYLGVDGFYNVLRSKAAIFQPVDSHRSDAQVATQDNPNPSFSYVAIAQRNLFNTSAKSAAAPKPSEIAGLAKTELNLTLWGTVTGVSDRLYAVIEDGQTRKQQLYREGDAVQKATINRILRDKVILHVNGKNEILEIAAPQTRLSLRRPARPQPTASGRTRTQRIALKREQVASAMQDVNNLMRQVNVKAHFSGGQPDGFIVSRIARNSIIRRMGLRNGDIITGVNGQAIQTMDDALKFYQNLSSADNVTLQIRRRGRPRSIEYTIR